MSYVTSNGERTNELWISHVVLILLRYSTRGLTRQVPMTTNTAVPNSPHMSSLTIDNVGHLSVGFNSGVPAAWCHNDMNRECGGAETQTARASGKGSVRRLRHQIY